MGISKQLITLCLLLALGLCVEQYFSDYRQATSSKKGLTFSATIWPE